MPDTVRASASGMRGATQVALVAVFAASCIGTFLFVIRDRATGAILFIGRLSDPNGE